MQIESVRSISKIFYNNNDNVSRRLCEQRHRNIGNSKNILSSHGRLHLQIENDITNIVWFIVFVGMYFRVLHKNDAVLNNKWTTTKQYKIYCEYIFISSQFPGNSQKINTLSSAEFLMASSYWTPCYFRILNVTLAY